MSNTWDTTHPIGEQSEALLTKLLSELGFSVQPYKDGKAKEADLEIRMTIELKRDVRSAETGNYAIEVQYKGQPSGISTTQATLFAIQTDTHFLLYHTSKLKDYIKRTWATLKKTVGGDDNLVALVLIPKLSMPEAWLQIPVDSAAH